MSDADDCPPRLRYSERKLWAECPEARPVIARLSRFRELVYELEHDHDGSAPNCTICQIVAEDRAAT